jgi:phosphoglycolate phosphatase-like HAD superfamily hydrolase
LTGNTRGGARAKLTNYRLFEFFAAGAFAEDPGERATIAVRALELARQAGPIADESLFVIGDTPHDIECARAIGAKTIAVATGGYSLEELQSHHPWRAMPELPPVDALLDLFGARPAEAGPCGPPEGGRHVVNRG